MDRDRPLDGPCELCRGGSASRSQKVDQSPERDQHSPATRVVEREARIGGTPVLEHAHESPGADVLGDAAFQRVGQSGSVQSGADHHVDVVDRDGTNRIDLEHLAALARRPSIVRAAAHPAIRDALMLAEVGGGPRHRSRCKACGRADDGAAQIGRDTHRHHVLLQELAQANSSVESPGHDVSEAILDGQLYADVGVGPDDSPNSAPNTRSAAGFGRLMRTVLAGRLAAEGAKVVLTDVLEDAGRRIQRDVGGNVRFIEQHVSRAADWKRVISETEATFGPIHVLVNNAGISPGTTIENTSEEMFRTVFDINQLGVFLGIKSVVPSTRKAGGGSIVIFPRLGSLARRNTSPIPPRNSPSRA